MSAVGCPSCRPSAPRDDGPCPTCGGEFLPAADIELLAERVGVPGDVLRDVVAAADESPVSCPSCQACMRRFPLRGTPVDVCSRCGQGFVTADARARLEAVPIEERAPPRVTPAQEAAARAPLSILERIRLALAPVAAVAVASAVAALLSSSPLFDRLVASLLLPTLAAPITALVVAGILPLHKHRGALLVAILVLIASAPHTITGVGNLWLGSSALITGLICTVIVVSPSRQLIRPRRIAIALGLVVGLTVSAHVGLDAYHRAKTEGCPDGAFWSSSGGRACQTADGVRHGPGVVATSTGRVLERGTWLRGRRHGAFQLFHGETGTPSGEGQFENGREQGPWLHIDVAGDVEASGNYVAGKRDGRWTERDPSGTKRTVLYRAGSIVSPE